MRRIGVLMATVPSDPDAQARLVALRQALQELGWTDGRNALIEYRWAGTDLDLMRAYAAELVGLTPDVILAHSPPGIMAAQRQTRTVPLVFVMVPAPVEIGLVASLTRPGGNITGLTHFETAGWQMAGDPERDFTQPESRCVSLASRAPCVVRIRSDDCGSGGIFRGRGKSGCRSR
jgi:ABC-type uncharacterized transport system substrate-binding protein